MRVRTNALVAAAVLVLGGGGAALGSIGANSTTAATPRTVNVKIQDGKLTVSPTSIGAGAIKIVAVNAGRKTHALAIMGSGLATKRTATLAPGTRATLAVVLRTGMFMLWDPVRGSMSDSKMLMARTATKTTATGGAGGGPTVITLPPVTMTGTMTDMDGGMDGC
jgi:hypothetical protein